MCLEQHSIEQQDNEWWIIETKSIGPYKTKAEAEEAVTRLRSFYSHECEPGYVTSEGKKQ